MKRKNPLKNNSGSAIIIVIVAMALVSMLGTSLLFGSYTSYQMKMVERKGKANFYNAESIVNEIRVGMQEVVSEAIAQAYTDVLVDYNESGAESENNFKAKFKEKLLAWKNEQGKNLFVSNALGNKTYQKEVLLQFVSNQEGVLLGENGAVEIGADQDEITLKDVSVRYTKDGYQTTVQTDFVIGIPDFNYTMSESILTAVPDFSLIANETLTAQGTDIVVNGSAYGKTLEVKNTGDQMTAKGGNTFIFKEGTNVEHGTMIAEPNASFWTKNVELGVEGKVEFAGDTYVANDLNLKGSGSGAKLAGRYFGFGNSDSKTEESSSILINGKQTKPLDMGELDYLLLAGHSFIGNDNEKGTNNIRMGESVSVKTNQVAYLVPVKCMKEAVSKTEGRENKAPSNPMLFQSDEVKDYKLEDMVDGDTLLWNGKKLSDYCNGVTTRMDPSIAGKTIVSFYMEFPTREKANLYFKDYFSEKSVDIERYLGMYSQEVVTAQTTKKNVSGNTFSYDGKKATLQEASVSVSASTSERIQKMFGNLCSTLSSNVSGEGSVYDYIVDKQKVNALSGTVYFKEGGGQTTAVITRDSSINVSALKATNPNLKIIISTGDIVVDQGFSGLLIAEGSITVKRDVSADRTGVYQGFTAKAQVGGKTVSVYDYLKVGAEIEGGKEAEPVTWDVEKLVTYNNWKKN